MRNILINLAVIFTMLILAACGGGGSSAHAPVQTPKTVATLKINLNAPLPASPITGASFTLTLPANVTPANTNGVVANGVVSTSGTFAGGGTVATYTAATANAPGTLVVVLANNAVPGVTQAGEVATINLQLSNGAVPTTASFGLSSVSVIDTLPQSIPAGATVASVTLN